MLVEGYARFDLDKLQGWIKLYHVLYCACGFPTITDQNIAAHEYLIPKTFEEMYTRITFMNLGAINLRFAFENGQGRVCALRHTGMCMIPSSKPLEEFASQKNGTLKNYFDVLKQMTSTGDFVKSNPANGEKGGFRKLLQLESQTTFSHPYFLSEKDPWHKGVTDLLQKKSGQDLLAADMAAPKDLAQLVSDALAHMIKKHPEELSFVAESKATEGNFVAKPVTWHFKQVCYLFFYEVWPFAEWSAVKPSFQQQLPAYVETFINKVLKRNHWTDKSDNETEVKELVEFRQTHKGCKTFNPLMVTSKFGRSETEISTPQDRESCAKEIAADKILAGCILFHKDNKKGPFSNFVGTGIGSGAPVLPPLFLLIGFLTYCVYDKDSAEIAHAFVNNNGQAVVEQRSFLVHQQPHQDVANKVRPKNRRSVTANGLLL